MRHPDINPFGKCDVEIKACLDESTLDGLTMLAGLHGQTKSQYVRHVLQCHVHGFAEVSRLAAKNGIPTIDTKADRKS